MPSDEWRHRRAHLRLSDNYFPNCVRHCDPHEIRLRQRLPLQRMPVFARNVVTTSHPLAAQAGLRMLLQGGNAVDAAIATAAAMTVVEPCSNGLGSDAFCILWDGEKLHGLNASGCAPQAWTPDYFKRKYGADAATPPQRGMGLGDRAGRGRRLGGAVASASASCRSPICWSRRSRSPSAAIWCRRWCSRSGRRPRCRCCSHSLASRRPSCRAGRAPEPASCSAFAAAGADAEAHRRDQGRSVLPRRARAKRSRASRRQRRRAERATTWPHKPDWVEPIAHDYRGYTLHEIPPNGQGIAALIALGILENFDLASLPVDSVAVQHLQIEAMKLAFADAYRYVADPSSMASDAVVDDARRRLPRDRVRS